MKHLTAMLLCLMLLPILTNAADTADEHPIIVGHALRMPNVGSTPYTGHRSTPTVVDKIPLSAVNATGYCWGLAYDWERDCLWVTQWSNTYNKMYAIQKTSPCVKIDSVTLGSGVPTYRLGIGYGGSDVMYMAGYNGQIYSINMTTGTGTIYRATPWSANQGLGFNAVDDAVYCGNWSTNQVGYAKPAQTGSWTQWTVTSPSGMSGGHSASASPEWLFTCNEDAVQAYFYQHSLTAGVPNTTPDSTWDLPAGMTQASTADCAFDGQYVYVLDQAGPDTIWVFDIGLGGGGGGPYVWDFETGWQDWTHTGAYSFPNGWAVKAANYNGASYIIPSSGDSSFWFDDDEAGSSAPYLQDTALSPVVPGFDCDLLKWGVTFNWLASSEIYEVGLKYHNGSSWQVVALRNYTADVTPRWDSVDVSAYAGYDSLQVYFYYNDGGGWQWYGAFDNVGLYPALSHDVGSVAFLSPGPMVAPGADDVVGVVANYGGESETYDVHCVVNDNTFAVVLDTTINVTTGVGEQDTLNFGSLTFVDGRTYDLTMATLLGTDVNPTNDTLEQTTNCTAVFWEVLTPMPYTRSGPFAGYAVISDTTYVHVFGGNPTASQTLHDVYNVTTATWSTGTPLPMAMNYGGHCSIDNKIYLIGSFIAASNPYMVIYDAESNVYTNVTLPTAINDPGIAVVDNSLIYIVGGGSPMGWYPSTTVQLYDVAGDSFFTGVTQLPGPIMSGVGGYLGNDTIIHAAGLTTGSVYVNTTYLGYINPSNPASITWSTGAPKPGLGTYRLNGGSFIPPSAPGRLYVAAGQGTGGVYLAATYAYISGTGWVTLPDKPAAHSNWGAAMVPLQNADGEYILYAAGGYTGSYLNYFHALHTGIDPTGIFEQPGEAPMSFGFSLLTSNPARSEVRFQFDMPYQGLVNFSVFDIVGRQIVNSDYSNISAGTHTLVWNRTDNRGRAVANGVYFYRVQAAGNVATGKLILVQ